MVRGCIPLQTPERFGDLVGPVSWPSSDRCIIIAAPVIAREVRNDGEIGGSEGGSEQ